jgi:hypothetical protein
VHSLSLTSTTFIMRTRLSDSCSCCAQTPGAVRVAKIRGAASRGRGPGGAHIKPRIPHPQECLQHGVLHKRAHQLAARGHRAELGVQYLEALAGLHACTHCHVRAVHSLNGAEVEWVGEDRSRGWSRDSNGARRRFQSRTGRSAGAS